INATGSYDRMTIEVLGSNEYFARHGGSNVAWVTALYNDVLGRSPDASGLSSWVAGLDGGLARTTVVAGFINSTEAHALTAQDVYITLLERVPEPAGLSAWVQGLDQGLGTEQMIARITN